MQLAYALYRHFAIYHSQCFYYHMRSTIRNQGARVDGPCVLGLILGNDCRYFAVERRDRATFIPLIQRECKEGSVIHSDE